ncbi:hypothetical protein Tco_1393368 [Tanacetum coccineum]
MMKDTPYELLMDEKNKQLGKNNEAKMTVYNALPQSRKKLLRALPLKWRANVMAIEEDKDLATDAVVVRLQKEVLQLSRQCT